MSTDLIHHYTSINTLALILKNRNVRFNRLDRVDDVSEAKAFGKYDLSKNIFVSCWTDSNEESIPLWHIYTDNMTGVRISLPKDFIKYQPLKPESEAALITHGEVLSPISWEQLLTDEYFILPNILSREQFERKVEYVDDIEGIYKDAVNMDIGIDGKANLSISKVGDLAGYKHRNWSFQEEFRFVLFILPSIPIPEGGITDKDFMSKLPSHVIQCIHDGIGPSIEWFDLNIGKAIDDVKVTLGPMCNEGDRIMIESLLSQYTSNGKVVDSVLKGTIRNSYRN